MTGRAIWGLRVAVLARLHNTEPENLTRNNRRLLTHAIFTGKNYTAKIKMRNEKSANVAGRKTFA